MIQSEIDEMSWIYLCIAGFFEVTGAISLKYTDGFSKPFPFMITVISIVLSVVFLGLAMKEIPLGTSYAIWTGIGAIGTLIAGILIFNESYSPLRIASAILLILGLIGMKLSSSSS